MTWGVDGRVQKLGRKILTVRRARTAIAASGVFSINRLRVWLIGVRDLTHLQGRLHSFIETNRESVMVRGDWRGYEDQATVRVTGATWTDDGPLIWSIEAATIDGVTGLATYDLGSAYWSPDVDTGAVLGAPLTNREAILALNVREAAPALMAAQRLQTHEVGPARVHIAGGWCDLATVGPKGIKIEKLRTWPEDRKGALVAP